MQAHLLDRERQVQARHGEVLQRSSLTPVGRGIINRWPIGRQLPLGVDWRGSWFAVQHAGVIEDIFSVPLLQ
jgi:hypothetical protein